MPTYPEYILKMYKLGFRRNAEILSRLGRKVNPNPDSGFCNINPARLQALARGLSQIDRILHQV